MSVRRITIENLRGIDSFTLTEQPSDASGAPWIILLGENGVGKSTVLRGLAFALAHKNVVGGVLARSRAPWCRNGTTAATITVETSLDAFRAVLSRTNGHTEVEQEREVEPPFVVAYGCKRGARLRPRARGEPGARLQRRDALRGDRRRSAPASHRVTRRKLAEQQEEDPDGEAHHILAAVVAVLCGPPDARGHGLLEGVTDIEIGGDDVKLRGEAIGDVPIEALSDGYITMMGWTVDLMARWIEARRTAKLGVPRRFNEAMTGVVLIDEIDLHLHPRWQYEVIERVRSFFPRLTFVVTTHNPMTLLRARPGEVHVLRREGGQTAVHTVDVPQGVRADELLTGLWFGLTSTTDPQTLALYEEHQRAIRGGTSFGDPSLRELEAELRRRLKRFGDTSLERIAHNALAAMPRPARGEPSPEQRAAMLDHVKATLAREAGARSVGEK
ncbi:MAG: AAA family ATPase [Polyangiales bacterium]